VSHTHEKDFTAEARRRRAKLQIGELFQILFSLLREQSAGIEMLVSLSFSPRLRASALKTL
jgi:hypothetical protein